MEKEQELVNQARELDDALIVLSEGIRIICILAWRTAKPSVKRKYLEFAMSPKECAACVQEYIDDVAAGKRIPIELVKEYMDVLVPFSESIGERSLGDPEIAGVALRLASFAFCMVDGGPANIGDIEEFLLKLEFDCRKQKLRIRPTAKQIFRAYRKGDPKYLHELLYILQKAAIKELQEQTPEYFGVADPPLLMQGDERFEFNPGVLASNYYLHDSLLARLEYQWGAV